MTYYKTLGENGEEIIGGNGIFWSLPTKNEDGTWTPGDWMPEIRGELIRNDICRPGDLIHWLGPRIFEAETGGKIIERTYRVTCSRARLLREVETWMDRTARLFAVWCAREALAKIEKPDPRSVDACDIAEKYANGEATAIELAGARAMALMAAMETAWRNTHWETRYVVSAARAAANTAEEIAWKAALKTAWEAAIETTDISPASFAGQTKKLFEMLGEDLEENHG